MANSEKFIVFLLINFLCEIHAVYDETTLDRLLGSRVRFFGHETTVGDIYGTPRPTIENFNPGDGFSDMILQDLLVPRINYGFPRDESVLRDSVQDFYSRDFHRELLATINNARGPFSLSLVGEPGSGKSRTMQFLEHNLRQISKQNEWIISVQMKDVININHGAQITLQDVVKRIVSPAYLEFFQNVLEVNPSRVNFFLDGIDQVPDSHIDNILYIISEIHQKGAAIITTSNNELLTNSIVGNRKIIKIPQLLPREIENFLQFKWTNDHMIERDPVRVRDYVKTVIQALERAPIPKTFKTAEILSRVLSNHQVSSVFNRDMIESISLSDYVSPEGDGRIQSMDLIRKTDNMRLNKMHLFNEITETRNPGIYINIDADTDIYGITAFKLIMGDIVQRDPSHSQRWSMARMQIELKGWTSYPYLTFENEHPKINPTGFVRPEYQEFYAAKYILSDLSNSWPPPTVDRLRIIFEDPKYTRVVDFINSGMKDLTRSDVVTENLMRIARSDFSLNYKFIDNLIRNGFDNLCSSIFEKLNMEDLKFYIHENTHLETRTKYIFGMLSEEQVSFSGTRRELMLQRNMPKSTLTLENVSPYFSPQENLQKLGEIVARLDNYIIFDTFMKKLPHATSSDFYNQLLFHTIDAMGIGSERQITDLVDKGAHGADVLVDGRTLTHAAMKWRSRAVLEYVIGKLGAPITDLPDNHGITPTILALETNIYPHYTPEGFWEFMSYWAEKKNSRTIDVVIDEVLEFKPESIEISLEHKTLLTGEELMTKADAIAKARITPPDTLSSEIRSLRRILVLKKCLETKLSSPLEMVNLINHNEHLFFVEIITNYRGTDTLSQSEDVKYHKTIETSCRKELSRENPEVTERVVQTIVSNTATENDILKVSKIITQYIIPHAESTQHAQIFDILRIRRLRYWIAPNLYTRLEDLMMQSRSDRYPRIIPDVQPANNELDVIEALDSDDSARSGYESCSSTRSRRGLGVKCLFSRKDVVEFIEDRMAVDPRKLVINTDAFLKKLFHTENQEVSKAKQLVQFVKGVLKGRSHEKTITGQHQSQFKEILKQGSFQEYFENRRFEEAMQEFAETPKKQNALVKQFKVPNVQKKIFAGSLMAIPFVKSFFDTIFACATQHTAKSHECDHALILLNINAGFMYAAHQNHKFVATKINAKMNALISTAESAVEEATLIVSRNKQLLSAARKVDAKFIVFGAILEIPNLWYGFKTIIDCKRPESRCTSQEMGAAKIVVGTFFGSTAAQVGALYMRLGILGNAALGAAIMVAVMAANAINDLVYYRNTYNTNSYEEFRTFWPSLIRMTPPQDVQNLIDRTDRIRGIDSYMNQYLADSGDNIIAYAMGIGEIRDKKFVATEGYINMAVDSIENTKNRSRVQPVQRDNVTLLCLLKMVPNQDFEVQNVTNRDAVYECDNSMVIADAERWKNRNETSYIVYNLAAIEKGEVIGSNIVNNMFQLVDSTPHMKVTGGPNNLTNLYILINPRFHGTIVFSSTSHQETLDLSHLSQNHTLSFFWHHELMGTILYDHHNYNGFNMVQLKQNSFNLHVIGRPDKPDFFQCRDPTTFYTSQRYSITVDGGGGSKSAWDTITGCASTRLRPFTHIVGMGDDTIDSVQIKVASRFLTGTRKVRSTIHLNKSHFGVRFYDQPILINTHSLIYNPSQKSLSWEFYYDDSSIMVLDIMPFYTEFSNFNQSDAEPINVPTCQFIDDYLNVTIQPIISLVEDNFEPLPVHQLKVFGTIQSSEVEHVFSRYEYLSSFLNVNSSVYLTNNNTKEVFIFGSQQNDKVLIGENAVLVLGGEGSDTYMISPQCTGYVTINNEAKGNDIDFLMMSCESVRAGKSLMNISGLEDSVDNVQLACFSTQSSNITYVILQNYLTDESFRHLIIYFNELFYVVLPQSWLLGSNIHEAVELSLFVHYDLFMPDTALVLNESDTFVVLKVTDKNRGWVAYRSKRDVIMALRNEDEMSKSTMIVLKNFFESEYHSNISSGWSNNRIFITNETILDRSTPKVLDAPNIVNLMRSTAYDAIGHSNFLYKEYSVNASSGNDVIIDHKSIVSKSDPQLGAIKVENGRPGDFHAKWTNESESNRILSLCAHKMCINILNWCESMESRINRMDFHSSYSHPMISVRYMDQLACDNGTDKVVNQLNRKLRNAQKRFKFSSKYNNSDSSRLVKCIAYFYADNITRTDTHKLFGFVDLFGKVKFINDNCLQLFTVKNLRASSQKATNEILRNEINIYKFSDEDWSQDHTVIAFLIKSIDQVSKNQWLNFLSLLYNTCHKNEPAVNFGTSTVTG